MGKTIVICGKGSGPNGKVVERQMPPTVRKSLEDYMALRETVLSRYGDESEGRLFVMDKRRRGSPATVGWVERQLSRLSARTGVRFTCHTLRRFYCMSMVDSGVDLDTVRRMMRHEDVSTTLANYVHADPRRMAAAVDAIEGAVFH